MADGTLFLLGLAAGAAGAAVVVRVLEGRRRKRESLLEERARRAERMAEVGLLAGGLAHEIKNPLSTLRLNLELMQEDLQTEPSQAHPRRHRILGRLDALERECERLEESLQDFLRYARGQRLQTSRMQVNELVDDLLTFATPQIEKNGIQLRPHLDPEAGAVEADSTQIKQALMNLVINAQQAMPGGGELIVTTRRLDDRVRIEITDTGCGIPEDEIDRTFQAYYSTKNGGSGLGLATTRRIVEDHGGSITVESEAGKGSKFTLILPAKPPVEAEEKGNG